MNLFQVLCVIGGLGAVAVSLGVLHLWLALSVHWPHPPRDWTQSGRLALANAATNRKRGLVLVVIGGVVTLTVSTLIYAINSGIDTTLPRIP